MLPTFSRFLVTACLLSSLSPATRALADAPPGRYSFPAAGTVLDTSTGLTWAQNVDPTPRTLDGATSYCQTLSLAGGRWRLPTVAELLTLVDPTLHNASIDPVAFPGTPSNNFWSSSPWVAPALNREGVNFTWGVNFTFGRSHYSGKENAYYVRCVR